MQIEQGKAKPLPRVARVKCEMVSGNKRRKIRYFF
jgi:hypothetical protein